MINIDHVLLIFDMGGQKRFGYLYKNNNTKENEDIISPIIKDTHLVAIVIDPTRYKESIKYIRSINPQIQDYTKIYIATKKDLMDEEMESNVKNLELILNRTTKDELVWISSITGENVKVAAEKIKAIVSKPGNYFLKDVNKRCSKLLFAGLSGAGKTTLFEKLKTNNFIKTGMTVGTRVESWHINYQE